MRIRAFIFPFPGTAINETDTVSAGSFPIEITALEAVEWYWRYREIDIETLFLGTSSSGTAVDDLADSAASNIRERHLLYPDNDRYFSADIEPSSDSQIVTLRYFHQVPLISPPDPPPYYENFRWKPSTKVLPAFVLSWQGNYASIAGKADVNFTLTSVIDSQDPLDFGYTTFNATVFGKTIPMAGTATYNAGATALSLAGCTLDIEASRWFEYKKDDATLPVWEETSGVQILDPRTASVP